MLKFQLMPTVLKLLDLKEIKRNSQSNEKHSIMFTIQDRKQLKIFASP